MWIALSFSGMAIPTAESQAASEDFALMGVFFAVLTAISRAAYILATEKVGAHPGYGRHVGWATVSTLLVLPFPFILSGNNLLEGDPDVHLLGDCRPDGSAGFSAIPAWARFLSRLLPHIYSVVLSLEPAIAALVGVIMLAEPTDGFAIGHLAAGAGEYRHLHFAMPAPKNGPGAR